MAIGILLAVGAGVLSALPLLLAATLGGGLLLVFLSPLPLFLVGLSQGLRGAAVAGASACILIAIMGGLLGAVNVLLVLAGPVLLLVRQALLSRSGPDGSLEWYPPGLLVVWLSGIGVVWLLISVLLLASTGEGIEAAVRANVEQMLAVMAPNVEKQALDSLSDALASLAIGAGTVGWLLVLAVHGVLAQGALLRLGHARRPAPDIAQLELPRWLDVVVAVVLALALLASGDLAYVAQNLLFVVLLPYFFVGLALVHWWARRLRGTEMLLLAFYVIVILSTGWLAPLLAGLGLIDQVAGLRRRKAQGGPGQEEE